MNTFEAVVMAFFPPNGRRAKMITPLSTTVQEAYKQVLRAGCRLEGELLRATGEVSCTISSEDDDLDIRVVKNGPAVQRAYEDMLKSDHWRTMLAEEEPS
jgi:hypothetical protein